jgi:hypothetical protein
MSSPVPPDRRRAPYPGTRATAHSPGRATVGSGHPGDDPRGYGAPPPPGRRPAPRQAPPYGDERPDPRYDDPRYDDSRYDDPRYDDRRYGAPARPPAGGRRGARTDGPSPREQRRRQRQRMQRRRRRVAVLSVLLIAALGVAGYLFTRGPDKVATSPTAGSATGAAQPSDAPLAGPGASASAEPSPTGPVTYTGAVTGPGTFTYASGHSGVLGTRGTLHRFRVAVEKGTGQDANEFAAFAVKILGDKRSWIGGGNVRLQQVDGNSSYDFILYLATPGTTEKMCLTGGLHTEKFTSCRIPGKVIVNLARWITSVPDYNAPLSVYQGYAINHEVGHELGHGHEACPGPGQLAPVMQQQTYGLKGCLANPWPYLDGKRYAGAPIP